ncbi:sugar transferase [Chryseobacterium potabilaquae]|uniref:UDP-N-acetylgalactosamine-undecaprenyl-phosphate N-acetylgalactosaminephosphotransferase n=1 Tax=Chryseobacterium potabilaquae TaxID=2675057 RepID=A0A6N4X6D1_9FLAO|nr:sugar transferase [Chryseobacterium potabilaquae]CAA7193873.1 UDP-N-acetylgalactosamine-undecaprenyl-phosphate N-acetylgalactosaminephosphotransferase [Chryseobacterium potabilaquae]
MKKYLNLSNHNERYLFINISSITRKILKEESFKKSHKSVFFNSESNYKSILEYIEKLNIKTIVIETSNLNHLPEKITNEIIEAKLHGIKVYEVHEFYERVNGRIPLVKLNANEYLVDDVFSIGLESNDFFLKRIIDLSVSVLLLPVALPVILFGSLLVFMNSPGNVFFSQERVGKNSKKFRIYKLRTMKNEHCGDFTKNNDERLLAFGKFLRITKIDELPQLFNVLNGNMSLIGPRPEQQKYVEESVAENSYFDLRHLVKPGITGWAQVNLPKATPKDNLKKLEYDLYYIKNFSPLLDVKILLKTVKVIFSLNSN